MRKYYFLLFILSLILLPSCRSVPYTDRSQFIITSEEEEIQLGKQAWGETLKNNKISTNEQYNSALERVGSNLSATIEEKNYNWQFAVLESEEANAFCLPGGEVAVYSGLFKIVDNDAELAAIVGHEIAHAIARHAGERLTHAYMQQFGGIALDTTLAVVGIPGYWGSLYGIGTELGFMLPYSRTQEYEADHIGMIIMANAGYNPKATIAFWKKFSKDSSYGPIQEFFATHPMDEKRLEEIEELIPMAMEYYKKAPVKRNLGEIYKTEVSNQ